MKKVHYAAPADDVTVCGRECYTYGTTIIVLEDDPAKATCLQCRKRLDAPETKG